MARFAWLFWGVLAMAAMVACRTNESPEAQVDDMKITAQVKEKIASDLGVSTVTNVSVNSTNGVVTLSGQVKTAENKSRAGEVAGGVPKVVRVINVLQVAPQP
jgi:osmotically-inducible protein OsmY